MEKQPQSNAQSEQPDFSGLMGQHTKQVDPNYEQYTPITESEFGEFANKDLLNEEEKSTTGIKIHIEDSVEKGTGIQKYVAYLIKGEDEKGPFEVYRRYSEFDALRIHMIQRWPGCFVPPIPSKQLINKTEMQTTLNRMRFLNEFLKKLSTLPHLYFAEQFQTFIRSPQADVIKILEKMKRQSYEALLKKYQDSFQDCVDARDQVAENINRINLFQIFVKENIPVVIEHKKEARTLAEARQRYDEKIGNVFDRILPEYEEGSLMEFTEWDQSQNIFARIHQLEEFAAKKNRFQQATKQNPYWLIYDLLKFQERQMEAIEDCFKGLTRITTKIEDITKQVQSNKDEIHNLQSGKTTLKSLITKGTNDEIINKLKTQNEQLEKLKGIVQELQGIVAQYMNKHVINNFKSIRKEFYGKAIKKVFSYQMFYVQAGSNFYSDLRDMSEQRIQSLPAISSSEGRKPNSGGFGLETTLGQEIPYPNPNGGD